MIKPDPKDYYALNRSVLALTRTAISLIVLGFVIEKFDFFMKEVPVYLSHKSSEALIQSAIFYQYVGLLTTLAGILVGVYAVFYYKKQLRFLKEGKAEDDSRLFYLIAAFIAVFGLLILLGMIFI